VPREEGKLARLEKAQKAFGVLNGDRYPVGHPSAAVIPELTSIRDIEMMPNQVDDGVRRI